MTTLKAEQSKNQLQTCQAFCTETNPNGTLAHQGVNAIIHTVGPSADAPLTGTVPAGFESHLQKTWQNIMQTAMDNNITELMVCNVSSGNFRGKEGNCARIAFEQ